VAQAKLFQYATFISWRLVEHKMASRGSFRKGCDSTFAEIVGWGKCIPPATLTNADLSTFLDTSADWILRRTGIATRPISHVPVSELAYVAAARALACAGVDAEEVDLLVIGSCTGDEQMPNTASRVQRSLGARRAAAVDVNTACTSFMYALSYGSALIRTGAVRSAVVVGSDTLSSFMDWDDRRPSVVFGDAAGAVVLRATNEPVGILGEALGCVYDSRDALRIKGIGSAYANAGVTFGTTAWDFDGPEVFRQAVHAMAAASKQVLEKTALTDKEIDLVVPHQANLRIIEAVARRLGTPMDKVFTHVLERGNLSSASMPVAVVDALEQNRVKPGAQLLLPGFGGGMTWSAHIIRWGKRVSPLGSSQVQLPATSRTGLDLVRSLRERKGLKPSPSLPEASYSMSRHVRTPASRASLDEGASGRSGDWLFPPGVDEDKRVLLTTDSARIAISGEVTSISELK
jgi:3-oxoacyl-[acyl-carrier-protein] synthase-3